MRISQQSVSTLAAKAQPSARTRLTGDDAAWVKDHAHLTEDIQSTQESISDCEAQLFLYRLVGKISAGASVASMAVPFGLQSLGLGDFGPHTTGAAVVGCAMGLSGLGLFHCLGKIQANKSHQGGLERSLSRLKAIEEQRFSA